MAIKNEKDWLMRKTGTYQKIGGLNHFTPFHLPPSDPALLMSSEMVSLYGAASFALGQLNEMGQRLPDPKRFIKAYVIKEALLSSAIEGVHTTLMEVFTHSVSGWHNKNTQLIVNYTHALDESLNMLSNEGLPLISRVILKAHKTLMSGGEGDKANPGNFRLQSVRVGELVPPPATAVADLMSGLEKYINEASEMPPLIKAGLAHVHFETIHPFLDGNGRIGRLLIVLMLINDGLLKLPIIYLSYYFKQHNIEYYQKLDLVRTHGDFEGWIIYYLKAIKDSALDAYTRAKEIENLDAKLKALIFADHGFAKMRDTAVSVLELLFIQPVTGVTELSEKLGKAYNTIQNILKEFVRHNIVSENIIHKRNKLYHFEEYLELLEKEYSSN
jgi:Fic family protein